MVSIPTRHPHWTPLRPRSSPPLSLNYCKHVKMETVGPQRQACQSEYDLKSRPFYIYFPY